MSEEIPPSPEDIETAHAILSADELSQFITDVYNQASATELGYKFLLSTMPTKIDEEIFQQMLDIAGEVPEKYKPLAAQVQVALNELREIHALYPSVESYSLLSLTGEMLKSRYISLDDLDNQIL